jgi:hypothetical protein
MAGRSFLRDRGLRVFSSFRRRWASELVVMPSCLSQR